MIVRPDLRPIDQPLYVVTMLENPLRWKSRYWNYSAFEQHVQAAGAVLYTAEVALGERPFEITEAGNPHHLQLRTHDELWHKENALNLLIARLPADAKYIAWVDADVQFARPDWVQETIQQLQHYPIVQMFSQAQDMGPEYSVSVPPAHSFGYCYREGIPPLSSPGPIAPAALKAATSHYGVHQAAAIGAGGGQTQSGVYWHPGFAWAARKETLSQLGGLMDFPILGSADWHMATGLIGQVEKSLQAPYTGTFKSWVREWARRAERHVRRDLGYVPGTILHHYHGEKRNRGYQDRYKLMRDFDPTRDIKRDWQGLWQLDPENIALRDAIRRYNRRRREDS